MSRRTFESPMDWEYQDRGPLDPSSPFAQVSTRKPQLSSFKTNPTPAPQSIGRMPNPFAVNSGSSSAHANPPSPSKLGPQPVPPHSSMFNPQIQRQFATGSSFRNPAFTTPQKRVDDYMMSEASAAEESPAAMTDVSEMPADTPDLDRSDDHSTITPARVNRSLFNKRGPSSPVRSQASGRGEVPRGTTDYLRDKVRKRKRQGGDRDVGSVRPRLPHDSDDSDSDWETKSKKSPKKRNAQGKGFFGGLLSTIHDHPNLPIILANYIHLVVNLFLVGIFMYVMWSILNMVRADFDQATDQAKNELMAAMEACATSYTQNRCSPKSERLPALNAACEEWERCMSQDPDSIRRTRISAENFADVINSFVGVLSWKAWIFILSAFTIAVLANHMVFGPTASHGQVAQAPMASQGSVPSLLSSSQDPNQAWLLAPIGQTPRHIRRELLNNNDGTDTDGSPGEGEMRMLTYPQTPSRRSPSKGERGRSPWKKGASPSKGYA